MAVHAKRSDVLQRVRSAGTSAFDVSHVGLVWIEVRYGIGNRFEAHLTLPVIAQETLIPQFGQRFAFEPCRGAADRGYVGAAHRFLDSYTSRLLVPSGNPSSSVG